MPVDLSFNANQEMIRKAVREYVERHVPLSRVREIDDSESGFSPEIWKQTSEAGWVGMLIPPQYGGSGASLIDAAALYEEMGRGLLPGPHLSSGVLSALVVLHNGSEEQKRSLLPRVASGELVVALAVTERESGWDLEGVQLGITQGEKGLVLSGQKAFVPDAQVAHHIICVGKSGQGLSLVLVDADARGFSRRKMAGFVGEKLAGLTFDAVRVPTRNLLGAFGAGAPALESAIPVATVLLCAYMVGAAQRVFEIAMEYTQRRVQFGRPVAEFTRVQDHLIAALAEVDGTRLTTYEAVWALERGRPEAAAAVSVAKAVASEAFYSACDAAHNCHGGIGTDLRYGLYLYTKKSRSLYHYLGDPAYHRQRLARLLL